MRPEGAGATPYRPPAVPGYAIGAINGIASRRPEFTLTAGEESVRLMVGPGGPFVARHWVAVANESGRLWLGLSDSGIDALVAPVAAPVSFRELSGELAEAVLAVAVGRWLEQVEAFKETGSHLEVALASEPGGDFPRFGLYRSQGRTRYQWAEVVADARACRWLGDWLGGLPVSGLDERWDWLSVPLSLALASMSLQRHELTGLVPGDMLLPPLQTPLRLRIENAIDGYLLGVARLEERSLIIEHWQEQTMAEQIPEDPPSLSSLERLEVELQFELGRVRLPLARLRELETGAVLSLDGDSRQPVSIYVNRQPAGRGEIVRIDDRLGIRITEWLGSDGP